MKKTEYEIKRQQSVEQFVEQLFTAKKPAETPMELYKMIQWHIKLAEKLHDAAYNIGLTEKLVTKIKLDDTK